MRQMKDYKRQRSSLDEQLSEARAKARFHDDHLRILDAWFSQVLDELRVLARRLLPTSPPSAASTAGMHSTLHTAFVT